MRRVDQYLHTARVRDAVSDEARLFRDRLRERGFLSSIIAFEADAAMASEVEPFDVRRPVVADAVLYHHATAPRTVARLVGWRGPKALLYHGVTPPELLQPYQPALAALLDAGRTALRAAAPRFRIRVADSRFGADEFFRLTGTEAGVLPFAIDARRFATAGRLPRVRGAAVARWLAVGRIAPNKGLLPLIRAFAAFVRRVPDATLVLVGAYETSDPYYWAVRSAIDTEGVFGRVRLTGSVDDEALVRWYESSDVYVCLSTHEGFCVPLVEAMRFDVPIVALARAAVPETLGAAGVLIDDDDPATVVAAVSALTADAYRDAVIGAQRRRHDAFEPGRTLVSFDLMIDRLVAR